MTPVKNLDSCKIMMGYYHVQENQQEIQGVEELKLLGSLPSKREARGSAILMAAQVGGTKIRWEGPVGWLASGFFV